MKRYIGVVFLAAVLLCSCSSKKVPQGGKYKVEIIDSEVYSRFITPSVRDGNVSVYYSDEVSLSMKKGVKTADAWDISFLDKVDIDERINPVMGKHFIKQTDDGDVVYYLDFQTVKKKFLKKINCKQDGKIYFDTSFNINCSDFNFVQGDSDFLFYIQDDVVKVLKFGENNTFTNYELNSTDFTDIIDFSVFKTMGYISLVYLDVKGGLYLVRLQNEGSKIITESRITISENATMYDSFISDDAVNVIFYDKSSLVNYYTGDETLKVGYYPFVSNVYGGFANGRNFLAVSALEKANGSSDVYSVYLVYPDGKQKKWKEEKILESESPISSISSCNGESDLYLMLSGSFLQMVTVPFKSVVFSN